eukprot:9477164-Pyramimonas_sp.AAC.1
MIGRATLEPIETATPLGESLALAPPTTCTAAWAPRNALSRGSGCHLKRALILAPRNAGRDRSRAPRLASQFTHRRGSRLGLPSYSRLRSPKVTKFTRFG